MAVILSLDKCTWFHASTAAGIYDFRQLQFGSQRGARQLGFPCRPTIAGLYGNYYQSSRIRLSSDMILKGPGMERQHSDSVLILFKEGLGKDNRQAVRTAFVREVSTVWSVVSGGHIFRRRRSIRLNPWPIKHWKSTQYKNSVPPLGSTWFE